MKKAFHTNHFNKNPQVNISFDKKSPQPTGPTMTSSFPVQGIISSKTPRTLLPNHSINPHQNPISRQVPSRIEPNLISQQHIRATPFPSTRPTRRQNESTRRIHMQSRNDTSAMARHNGKRYRRPLRLLFGAEIVQAQDIMRRTAQRD